jgi:cysteinyl-tRNA synthetase
MEDYFGYRVTYVMNITDIDDKVPTSMLVQGSDIFLLCNGNIYFFGISKNYFGIEIFILHSTTEQ